MLLHSVVTKAYLTKLGNVNQTSQVLQIGAFIIESPQVEMLSIVSGTKRVQNFRGFEFYASQGLGSSFLRVSLRSLTSVHGTHHTCDESIDTVTLLDQGNQGRYTALIVVGASEMRENKLLE